jgi:hypothetical protein
VPAEALDEEAPIEAAAKEFNVTEALRNRLVARRDSVRSRGKRTRRPCGNYFC